MIKNRENLSGVFAPVVTPFKNDAVQIEDLKYNLEKLNKSKLKGYLVLGSNGEFKSLNDKEQFQVLEVFDLFKSNKIIMVGTGSESTKQTIEKSNIVAKMGFDYLSILTPSYFTKRMDGPTLRDYYIRIADSVSIPVIIYNAPGFASGIELPSKILHELSKHPNIVGVKDSSPSGPAKFLNHLNSENDFSVLAGSANFFYPSLHLGATGGILSMGNFFPDFCYNLYELFQKKEFEQAKKLHFKLARLNGAISGAYGVAGVKGAMNLVGFKGGEPRHPLQVLSENEAKKIKDQMHQEGFL
jgi:4-hydroxy-2-oxoglutarate aldolase